MAPPGDDRPSAGVVSRRQLLGGAAALAASGMLGPAESGAGGNGRAGRRRRRARVAVLGGGVAGLTAAHELAERGFEVTVYERRALGGKGRTMPVPGSAAGGRRPLPGAHGIRLFFGFYQNLPDTMRRIPFGANPNGVFDNLVSAPHLMLARAGGRSDLILPMSHEVRRWTPEQVRESLIAFFELAARMPPNELAYFAQRLIVYFSSCEARRVGQWERRSWWEFLGADRFSDEYGRVVPNGITRQLVAAKADLVNARTMGTLMEASFYTVTGRAGTGTLERLLNGPTDETWLDPWIAHLRRLGVRFRVGCAVEALRMQRGRVSAARIRDRRGRRSLAEADWYVCALPLDRARRLWSPPLVRADPRLALMSDLHLEWLSGIQFYLREPTPIVEGIVSYVDSPWAVSSLSQSQFWRRDFARDYGDGRTRDVWSCDISEWKDRGVLHGRPARELRRSAIAREVWEQMSMHLNDGPTPQLSSFDDLVVSWFLDPGIVEGRSRLTNEDPLPVWTPGSWERRPTATTAIPNLFLASDYVRVDVDITSMEGANEAARRAVNGLLDAAGSSADRAPVFELLRPQEWEAFKRVDELRFERGEPNLFEAPWAELPPAVRQGAVSG